MLILGINAFHPDASACIMQDGVLIAACEEERFNRIKHCAGFPSNAVRYCLAEANANIKDVDYIAISKDPKVNLKEKIFNVISHPRRLIYSLRERFSNIQKIYDIKTQIADALDCDTEGIRAKVIHVEHHLAHLSSAFFLSGFDQSVCASIDALGDFSSTMLAIGQGNKIGVLKKVLFPHSLGFLYTAICQYLGFKKFGDEGKVMALASFAGPDYLDQMNEILILDNSNGLFRLNLDYFVHHDRGVSMTWGTETPKLGTMYSKKLIELLGAERGPAEPIEKRHEQIASSLQTALENAIFFILNNLSKTLTERKLSLAGGVIYNCVANGKIPLNTDFKGLFIQPAAGDSGTSVGSAFYVYHQILNYPRKFELNHVFWGPQYSDEKVKQALKNHGLDYAHELNIEKRCAQEIAKGRIVGWFQGRTEFGPRALGNRSILADPRCAEIKDILNKRIKHREPFRPFAPSILEEERHDYFEYGFKSPFMIIIDLVKKDKMDQIPAVTHVDGTGRLQTVSKETNPRYWQLIYEFKKITGIPVVLNTSFNENEPIVCSPDDAINCFKTTRMDVLALGNYIVYNKA